ncbi:GDSL-type esterase/lipase family protein [Chryseolinea sp. T2]|uniref:SGNH/GDSL hydrolase family protein n=1 Tax=Chryseolinea sp. T2 TaxID=3129255 RepID=UPI003076CCDC
MKILFLGNSITRGQIGESFVASIQIDNPIWSIHNAGVDGDTLKNISDRLVNILSDGSEYDFVVIEAGHNDIILPQFNKKGLLFQFALGHLLRHGRQPLGVEDFRVEYLGMIKLLREKTKGRIVLTTLSCINENLLSETNLIRIEYNKVIRAITKEANCLLADVSEAFETVLKESSQTDYLLESFLSSVYFDKKICRQKGGVQKLSKKRKLTLTIDGIHLNEEGANIYRRTIEKSISEAAGDVVHK